MTGTHEIRRLRVQSLDQAPTLKGRPFRGSWFRVDPGKVKLFDVATYVVNNVGELDESSYPDGLVEGFHLLGLLDHLTDEIISISGGGVYALNYGLNSVRFITPVTTDRAIRLHGTVSDVTPKNGGYLVQLTCTVELEDAVRPAFVAEFLALWLPAVSTAARS